MRSRVILIFYLFILAQSLLAQPFQASNLPILVITTDNGEPIPDEPKIHAHLGIIWNGDGMTNHLSDPYNHYDGDIGIEVRGSSSQWFDKKGYAVETQNPDGASNNVSLLGFPSENDWVLHGPYSDKSLMRNALAYITAGWIMEYAPRVKFCEVMMNGDYLGVYLFTEKIKQDNNRVNISKLMPDENSGDELTGGYILKFDKWTGITNDGFASNYPPQPGIPGPTFFLYHYPEPEDISESQKSYIKNWIDQAEWVLKSPNFADPAEGYRKYFDMGAFFQMFFIQEISRNVDGYRLSTFMYKDKESKGGKLKMGPVWDFNLGYGNVDYCIGSGTSGWAIDFADFCPNDWVPHFWWHRMWEDPAFLKEMKTRWFDLRNDTLSNDRVLGLIDSLETLLTVPAQRNFQRWSILNDYIWPNSFIGGTYAAEVDFVKKWTTDRLAWLDGAMQTVTDIKYDPYKYFEPVVYPNPGWETLNFKVYVRSSDVVRIELYNALGSFLGEKKYSGLQNGENHLEWDIETPAGIYFYRIWFNKEKILEGKVVRG